jgi:uncharacterized protein (DUF1499 family)
MRRHIIEEPVTSAAPWSRRFGLFAVVVAAIGVALIRGGSIDAVSGLAVMAAALVTALGALALALLAFWRVWSEGRRGLGMAIFGFLLAVAVLAWPAWLAAKAIVLPQLNDVTTDIDDPPVYSRSTTALAARGGRVPGDVPRDIRLAQREAYPQVAPLNLDLSPEDAFDVVREAAKSLGWEIVEAVPPGGRSGIARLEAVDRTFLLRFADDITIRIRPRAEGVRIDMRSASRLGQHDFGVNAARITKFLDAVQAEALAR